MTKVVNFVAQHLADATHASACNVHVPTVLPFSIPVDYQYKGKKKDDKFDHSCHLLFWQLPEDLCDIDYVISLQIHPQIPKTDYNLDSC